jgi:hypothetical protein
MIRSRSTTVGLSYVALGTRTTCLPLRRIDFKKHYSDTLPRLAPGSTPAAGSSPVTPPMGSACCLSPTRSTTWF